MTMATRLVHWAGTDAWRAEVAAVELAAAGVSARGTQLGIEPVPYRLDYELEARRDWITERFVAAVTGEGWRRRIELRRSAGDGRWSCSAEAEGEVGLPAPGGDVEALHDALDCDLGLSPLTNLMPIRRAHLHRRPGALELVTAWVEVPALALHRYPQRYEHVSRRGELAVVRFLDLGPQVGFRADLELDADGLVLAYPELARRVPEGPQARTGTASEAIASI